VVSLGWEAWGRRRVREGADLWRMGSSVGGLLVVVACGLGVGGGYHFYGRVRKKRLLDE